MTVLPPVKASVQLREKLTLADCERKLNRSVTFVLTVRGNEVPEGTCVLCTNPLSGFISFPSN